MLARLCIVEENSAGAGMVVCRNASAASGNRAFLMPPTGYKTSYSQSYGIQP